MYESTMLFESMNAPVEHEYASRLLTAMSEVQKKHKGFVDAAENARERKQRRELVAQDVRDIAAEYLDPIPATIRRVNAALKVDEIVSPVSTWEFDYHMNGWKSSCADSQHFLCTHCGRGLMHLGFQHCKCGATWNGYSIKDENKESASPLVVWREVEEQDTKIAKTAQDDKDDLVSDDESATIYEPEDVEVRDATIAEADLIKESPDDSEDAVIDPDEYRAEGETRILDNYEAEYKAAFIMGYRMAATGRDIHDDCSEGFLDGYEAWATEED